MKEYQLTVGLFDKDIEKQVITTEYALDTISELLIQNYGIYAFTAINCYGCYRMESSGNIVKEPSIRIEIADNDLTLETVKSMIADIKLMLNQESVMLKFINSDIDFI